MSTAPFTRLPPGLEVAVQRIRQAARDAARQGVDALGVAALSAANLFQRDICLAAQFELNRHLAAFVAGFDEGLDRSLQRELAPRDAARAAASATTWDALSLVDNSELERKVAAERFGLDVAGAVEAELGELDAYVAALLAAVHAELERNPLRPEVIGEAMLKGIDEVSERPEVRKLLQAEIGRLLVPALRSGFADAVDHWRRAGVQPLSLAVRLVAGSAHDTGRATSGYDSRSAALDAAANTGAGGLGAAETDGARGASVQGGRADAGTARPGAARRGTPIGQVDAGLMDLMRRLAFTESGPSSAFSQWGASGAGGLPAAAAPNLIRAHRDELRQASSGSLDHLVIDVVGSLFDQILSDARVPPQLARQIARLQLPVLRAALGDPTFFASRRHPVRRFVNRIASLAVGFDDLGGEAGRRFVERVRALVQQVVEGDFDQIEVYEEQLGALERFVAEQGLLDVEQEAGAATLLARKEADLRLLQRYTLQLHGALQALPMADFVRDFLTQVWSQALWTAHRAEGPSSARLQRLRDAGRDLVVSVQPKGSTEQRKAFLTMLPRLMKDLNEGIALIGWPDAAQKAFFARLLPAHAESLKGQGLRTLDYNLLTRQVEAVFQAPPPSADAPPGVVEPPVLDDAVQVPFSTDEAKRIGLVRESAVDWDGNVDIDLGAEPPPAAEDLRIAGLPEPEAPEPTDGGSLADHVEVGFAYRMNVAGRWQKVRLSHVSPGRAFFVFTHGSRHAQTISLTQRVLRRLCEAGRLRAYESAYLLERATARARRQLATLAPRR